MFWIDNNASIDLWVFGLVSYLAEESITIHSRRYEYLSWLPDNSSNNRRFCSDSRRHDTLHSPGTVFIHPSSWILRKTLLFPVAGNYLRCCGTALIGFWCPFGSPVTSSCFLSCSSFPLATFVFAASPLNHFLSCPIWLVLIIARLYFSHHRKPRLCDTCEVQ